MTYEIDADGLRRGLQPRPMPRGPASIAALVESFPQSDAIALIDRDGATTYRELSARIRAVVRRLRALGVGPGTVVAASGRNCAAVVVAFLAVQRIGAVWVGLNTALAPPEKAALIADCAPQLVLVDSRAAAEIEAAIGLAAAQVPVLMLDAGALGLETAADPDPDADAAEEVPMPNPMAVAAIGYTSGTTGVPKGVVHTQHSLMTFANGSLSWERGEWLPSARRGISISVTILNLMVYGPLLALTADGSCVLMDRPDAAGVGEWIQSQRVEIFNGAAATLNDLLLRPDLSELDLSSLKAVAVGGGPVPEALFELFRQRFGYELIADYGLTESPASVVTTGSDPEAPASLFTKAHPQLDIAILDDQGVAVAPGTAGELCIGPRREGEWAGVYTGMLGYWRRPDATRAAFHGAWLRTGDQATIDEKGVLRIAGRQNEMILRGGANIFPAEVEALLRRHEMVAEAVVLGLPDERLGQIVAAFLKLKPGANSEKLAPALTAFCHGQIARLKIPERWFLVDEFPRNALSKPIRREVSSLTQNELL